MDSNRQAELQRILENQCQKLIEEIRNKKHELRSEKTHMTFHRGDDGSGGMESDSVVESVQSDIKVSLVQAKIDTLHRVEDALWCLKRGEYGNCSECGEEIPERRLHALPFAVRCKDCEEAREVAEQREHSLSRRNYDFGLFYGSNSDL
ncbi:MAG: TraR/DksA family transcriptional regulator [Candidatus Yanofskybacteria bacterium]|nr:TraR/DksA family transcriptional regulator [Candidatus Yanofskybacteria bacterium]